MALINRIRSVICRDFTKTLDPQLGSRDWSPLSILKSSGCFLQEAVSWSQGVFAGKRIISFKSRIQFIKWLISKGLYDPTVVFCEVLLGNKWLRKVGFSGVEASLVKKDKEQIESLDLSVLEDVLKDPEKFKKVFSKDTAAWALAFGDRELMDLVVLPNIIEGESKQINESGADLNVCDDHTQPSLFNAVLTELRKPSEEAVDFTAIHKLIEQGADVNVRDEYGNTLLLHVLFNGEKKENKKRTILAQFLIEKGADLFVKNPQDISPFLLATYYFPKQCQDFMLSFINHAQSPTLANPLHVAKEEEKEFYRKIILHALTLDDGLPTYYSHHINPLLGEILKDFTEEYSERGSFESVIRGLQELPVRPEQFQGQNISKLSFINTGWEGHTLGLVFYQGYLFICNRGDRGFQHTPIFDYKSVLAYKINPARIDAEMLAKIYANCSKSAEAGARFIYGELAQSLEGTKDDFCEAFEQAATHKEQKLGNCGWVHPKLSVIVALLLDKYFKAGEEAKKQFNFNREFLGLGKTFSTFTKIWFSRRITSSEQLKLLMSEGRDVSSVTKIAKFIVSKARNVSTLTRKIKQLANFILRRQAQKKQQDLLDKFFKNLKKMIAMETIRLPISSIIKTLCQGLGLKTELMQAYERRGGHFEAAILDRYL